MKRTVQRFASCLSRTCVDQSSFIFVFAMWFSRLEFSFLMHSIVKTPCYKDWCQVLFALLHGLSFTEFLQVSGCYKFHTVVCTFGTSPFFDLHTALFSLPSYAERVLYHASQEKYVGKKQPERLGKGKLFFMIKKNCILRFCIYHQASLTV